MAKKTARNHGRGRSTQNRSSSRPNNRSNSRSRARSSKNTKRNIPGWMWLFTGLCTGFLIAFLFSLTDIKPGDAEEQVAKKTHTVKKQVKNPATKTVKKTQPKVIAKQTEPEKNDATKFEFYTLLPESEVIVPNPNQNNKNNQPNEQVSPPSNITYMLQAGSFRNLEDADRLRARLILMGLDAKMHKVSLGDGEIWHRVQIGPYTSVSRLNQAQAKLTASNIETLTLKLK